MAFRIFLSPPQMGDEEIKFGQNAFNHAVRLLSRACMSEEE